MTRTSFLVGISAIALAAGTASAQTTTADSANNVRTVNCAQGDPANVCTVNNSITFNPANSNNTGTASAVGGTGNAQTVNQNGNNNSASTGTTGSNNFGEIDQGQAGGGETNNNLAQIQATGTLNSATISQGADVGGNGLNLGGNNNKATVTQTGNAVAAVNAVGNTASNEAEAYQAFSNNSVTITQTRTAGAADGLGGNYAGVGQGYLSAAGGLSNSATITQNGTNLASIIIQDDVNGSGFAASNNRAVVSQTGLGSVAQVQQTSRGNSATVTLGGGNVDTGINVALVSQQNDRIDNVGGVISNAAPTSSFSSNNQADIAIIGLQNSSTVAQNGINNSATVSMLGGGLGNTGTPATTAGFPDNRPEGNTSELSQTGRGNYYAISAGGSTSTNPNGARGNSATVTQGDAGSAASAVSNARNMRATVYQRGTADTVTINQQNFNAGGVQFGSSVDVSQLSTVGSATINQNGTNSASVTQGLNADNSGGFQTLNLDQTDYGSVAIAGSGADPFGGPAGTRTANVASIAQYGDTNSASVTQESINASATLFQARLSDNNVSEISQGDGQANGKTGAAAGTQATSNNLTASVTQTGSGSAAYARQDGTNSLLNITQSATNSEVDSYQSSTYNSSTVTQAGEDQFARISQSGTGTASRRNLATITQTGDTQFADITQSQTSGASAAGAPASGPAGGSPLYPNARAAGANSAEAVIIQTNSRNSASITQNGLGQYARIEQNGILNSGTITQDAAATNAVAILEQNGNGNTYTIAQGAGDAGAYTRVQQTGNSNALISTTTFGTGATGAGNGPGVPNAGPF